MRTEYNERFLGSDYKPPLNPDFVRRARLKRARKEAQQKPEPRKVVKRDLSQIKDWRERSRIYELQKLESSAEQERLANLGSEIKKKTRDWDKSRDIDRSIQVFLEPKRSSAIQIIEHVAAWYGLTANDVLSQNREHRMIDCRFDAIAAVAVNFPELSTPAIGRIFGRDHSTILHALKKRGLAGRKAKPLGS